MVSDQSQFTDNDLKAYLLGHASDDLSKAIEAAVDSDPSLVDRLESMDDFGEAMRPASDAWLSEAPDARLQNLFDEAITTTPDDVPNRNVVSMPFERARRRRSMPLTVGAAAAGLILGFLSGVVVTSDDKTEPRWIPAGEVGSSGQQASLPPWGQTIVAYAAILPTEASVTFDGKSSTERQREQIDVDLDALAAAHDLSVQRVESLTVDARPLTMAILTRGTDSSLVLALRRNRGDAPSPSIEFEQLGQRIAYRASSSHEMLLSTADTSVKLSGLADAMARTLKRD